MVKIFFFYPKEGDFKRLSSHLACSLESPWSLPNCRSEQLTTLSHSSKFCLTYVGCSTLPKNLK